MHRSNSTGCAGNQYSFPDIHTSPLHYNILFGVDYVGLWWRIIFIPATGLAVILVNALLGWLFCQKDQFFAHVLNFVSLLVQIILVAASFLLVFLNV